MAEVYIIEEAECDPLENHPDGAFFYAVRGFVADLATAQRIVLDGGRIGGCWVPSSKNALRYRYRAIPPFTQ